jgi:hypothetical protein
VAKDRRIIDTGYIEIARENVLIPHQTGSMAWDDEPLPEMDGPTVVFFFVGHMVDDEKTVSGIAALDVTRARGFVAQLFIALRQGGVDLDVFSDLVEEDIRAMGRKFAKDQN